MANKQITHPLAPLPSWANDENINDPGQPWDVTPTKVEPGAGKRDDGFLPEENPSAQHLNQQLNELGRWVQYLSNIQVLNWSETAPVNVAFLNSCEALVYDEGSLAMIVGGRADVIHLSKNYQLWDHIGPSGAAQTWTHGASKPPEDVPTHSGVYTLLGGSASPDVITLDLGGYTTHGLPGAANTSSNYSLWDRDSAQWIVGGSENSGGDPSFWYSSHPVAGFTQFTLPTVNSSTVQMIAAATDHISGGPFLVAIGEQVAPNHDVWTSSDGQTWAQAVPTGINVGQEMKSIIWNPAQAVFVLTTDDDVYTSTNGTAWTPVATGLGGTFPVRCLATDGAGLLVSLNDFGPFGLRYSTDGGATWRIVFLPPTGLDGPPGTAGSIIYSRTPGRFFASFTDAPNQGSVAYSFAVGESLYTPDGFDAPTVT